MDKMSLTSCHALSTPGKFSNVDRYATSVASSRFETYTKEQLLYFYGIVNILLIYVYNIATVGWQLVHYTVYGTKKSDNGRGEAEYSGLAAIQYLYNTSWSIFLQ